MGRTLRTPATGLALAAAFLVGFASSSGAAAAVGSGTGIPVLVLVNDGDEHTMRRSNGIVRAAMHELRDQFTRYGYDVKTEEAIAAAFDWDLAGRRDTTELLRLAYAARDSGRPGFDIVAVVIFEVLGSKKDRSFATLVEVTVRGAIYDAVAQRHLASFGPMSDSVTGPASCPGLCEQEVARPLAARVAAIVGDEARRELAQLTGELTASAEVAVAEELVEPYGAGLVATYGIEFENFTTSQMMQVVNTMQTQFPGYVRSSGPDGTGNRGSFGYTSRAPDHKIYAWLNLLMEDVGLEPDRDVQVIKQGTTITLKRLGRDVPAGTEPPTSGL